MIETLGEPIKEYINSQYLIRLYKGDVFYLEYLEGVYIDLMLIKEIKKVGLELVESKKIRSLINFKNIKGMSNEVQDFLAIDVELNAIKSKEALITNSYSTTFMIGVYLAFKKPKFETKAFNTINKAINWLVA